MTETRNPIEALFSDALREALTAVLERAAERVEPPDPGPLGLSIPEAAQLLGVSRDCMSQLVRRADFPAIKLGGKYLISRAGLVEWLAAQTKGGGGIGKR